MKRCVMSQGYGLVVEYTQHARGLCSFLRNTTATIKTTGRWEIKVLLLTQLNASHPAAPVGPVLGPMSPPKALRNEPLPIVCLVHRKSGFFFFMRPKRQCSARKGQRAREQAVEPPPSPTTGMFTLGFKLVVSTTLDYSVISVHLILLTTPNSHYCTCFCLMDQSSKNSLHRPKINGTLEEKL